MAKAEASIEELVSMTERGELRLPEMQCRYVWRSPRVRDLFQTTRIKTVCFITTCARLSGRGCSKEVEPGRRKV